MACLGGWHGKPNRRASPAGTVRHLTHLRLPWPTLQSAPQDRDVLCKTDPAIQKLTQKPSRRAGVLVIGAIAGLYPAARAARLAPVEGVRAAWAQPLSSGSDGSTAARPARP